MTPFRDTNVRLDAEPQFDMSLGKTTRIGERMSAQFRIEAFNVFNRFWMPLEQFNNNPERSNFGQIIKGSAAQENSNFPRQVQIAFKFIF